MRQHRLIICVDIEGSARPFRTDADVGVLRAGMYKALKEALRVCGVDSYYNEDRGDGAFVLVPAEVQKDRVLTKLPPELVKALADHNQKSTPQVRFRLRVSINEGEVSQDCHGVYGEELTKTFRLLNCDTLKNALAASPAPLAIIASDRIYQSTIKHFTEARPETYEPFTITAKETVTKAWIRLADEMDFPRPANRSQPPAENAAPVKEQRGNDKNGRSASRLVITPHWQAIGRGENLTRQFRGMLNGPIVMMGSDWAKENPRTVQMPGADVTTASFIRIAYG